MDEILWCYHSNETSSVVLSHGTVYLVCSSNFCVFEQNGMCDHLNEISSVVLSHGAICLVCCSYLGESVDTIVWCGHSNETFSVVLSHRTIYIVHVCSSNF